jgi:hypothetical protein
MSLQRVFLSPLHTRVGRHGANMRQSPSGRQWTTQIHRAGVCLTDTLPNLFSFLPSAIHYD